MSDDGRMARQPKFGIAQGRRGLGAVAIQLAEGWRRGDAPTRFGLGLASAVGASLVGAGVFGAVHIFGGAFHGNPRAVGFGVALTAISVGLLAAVARILRLLADRAAGVR